MTRLTVLFISLLVIVSCNSSVPGKPPAGGDGAVATNKEGGVSRHFRGALTGGFKGDSIFFDVSADGKRLENLMFKGYWRCSGRLELLPAAGPDGSFTIVNNKVDDHISEPPDGGSTAWRFDLSAAIEGDQASGRFRMNINNLGCNTGMLSWTAVAD